MSGITSAARLPRIICCPRVVERKRHSDYDGALDNGADMFEKSQDLGITPEGTVTLLGWSSKIA
jgi:hypothetical protein